MGFHTIRGLTTEAAVAGPTGFTGFAVTPAGVACPGRTAPALPPELATVRLETLAQDETSNTRIGARTNHRRTRPSIGSPRRFDVRPLGDIQFVPERTNLGRLRDHVLPWIGWWVLSMLLWLLLTSTTSVPEAIVGSAASVIVATTAEILRARGVFGFRPRMRWIRLAMRIPVQIASDTVRVFRALLLHVIGRKRVRGSWHAVPFRYGREGNPSDVARRGLAILAIGTSPNSVAVNVDADQDELLVHQLVSAPRDLDTILGRTG